MKNRISLPSLLIVSACCSLAVGTLNADPSCTNATRFVSSQFIVQGSVAGAGDIDGDGYADFLLGDGSGVYLISEKVAVVSGRTKEVIYLLTSAKGSSDGFGTPVSVGDLNSDGIPDIVVGAELENLNGYASGRIDVFNGASGSLLYSVFGDSAFTYFGQSIAKLGDVNDDGHVDFLVYSSTYVGLITAISGADGSEIYTVEGDSTVKQLGFSIARLGDVNDDGKPDFVAAGHEGPLVRVFSGADGALIHEIVDPQGLHESQFGWGLSGAGDLNGDGVEDILVGSPFREVSSNQSTIYVFSGKTAELLFDLLPTGLQHNFGQQLTGGADLNGDEIADIVVLTGPSHERILQIFSGFDQSLVYADTGDLFGLNFRNGPALAGDINGDCLDDVIIGGGVEEYLIYSLSNLCARPASCTGCCNVPGDADNNQSVNIADVTFLISRIFAAGSAPVCSAEADANADGRVNIADLTYLIARIFAGGPPPLCGPAL